MEISKILSSREEVTQALMTMLSALDKQFPAGVAQFSLGKTCAHYSTGIAEMEGLSRALWGLFPLMAGGADVPFSEKYINAIKLGTDPQSPSYWGDRAVRSASGRNGGLRAGAGAAAGYTHRSL